MKLIVFLRASELINRWTEDKNADILKRDRLVWPEVLWKALEVLAFFKWAKATLHFQFRQHWEKAGRLFACMAHTGGFMPWKWVATHQFSLWPVALPVEMAVIAGNQEPTCAYVHFFIHSFIHPTNTYQALARHKALFQTLRICWWTKPMNGPTCTQLTSLLQTTNNTRNKSGNYWECWKSKERLMRTQKGVVVVRGSPAVENSRKGIPVLVFSRNNNKVSVTRRCGRWDPGPEQAGLYSTLAGCRLLLWVRRGPQEGFEGAGVESDLQSKGVPLVTGLRLDQMRARVEAGRPVRRLFLQTDALPEVGRGAL